MATGTRGDAGRRSNTAIRPRPVSAAGSNARSHPTLSRFPLTYLAYAAAAPPRPARGAPAAARPEGPRAPPPRIHSSTLAPIVPRYHDLSVAGTALRPTGASRANLFNPVGTQFQLSQRLREQRRAGTRHGKLLNGQADLMVGKVARVLAAQDPSGHHAGAENLAFLLKNAKASTTFNQYASYWNRWESYSRRHKGTPLPADPWLLAHLIAEEAQRALRSSPQMTASITESLCSSVRCAHELCSLRPPTDHTIVKLARESARRLLGFRNRKKYPLREQHLQAFYDAYCASRQSSMEDVTFMLLVMTAYEACLRFDDVIDVLLGDMIWTKEYIKIFLVQTKTDKYKDGQWCTIMVTDTPCSAFQLLLRVLAWLLAFPHGVKKTFGMELVDIPLAMTSVAVGTTLRPKPTVRRTYDSFLAKLKAWCTAQGWNASLFATHSLRRGGATDLLHAGVAERLIQRNGRWTSVSAFEGYLDDEVALTQRIAAFRAARG